MAYIGKSPSAGVRQRYYFTATGGETSISGADDNSKTLIFSDGEYIDVYLNGVLLVAGTDYVTTTTNTISSLAALSTSDIVEVVAYDVFSVADTVSASSGGTFSANVAVTGDLTVDTNTLYVDSTNNRVGIGTSSPSQPVEIAKDAGQGATPPTLRITNTKADYGSSATTNVPHGAIEFYMSEGSGNYPAVGAAIKAINESIYAENHGLAFFTNSDTSTPTERLRILSSGGITFNGDTAAANALDDYEEGTWTPTFQASTDPTVTYATRYGKYTKIGSLVTCLCILTTDGVSGGSGALKITGLPFAEEATVGTSVIGHAWSGEIPMKIRISSSSAFLYYRSSIHASDINNNTQVSDMATGSGGNNRIEFTITYTTAS